MPDAADTYRDAIVIDGVSPLIKSGYHLDRYIKGGVTAVCPTVGVNENAAEALRNLGLWRRLARDRSDLLLVGTAADIRRAKREGRLGIIPISRTSRPSKRLDLVDAWAGAGVRMIQLSYNVRNLAGDGCEEPTDAGLSRFGRALVERLEAARVVVDCSHTGDRTTIEAVRMATRPIVVSHANARAVFRSARNLTDETIRAARQRADLSAWWATQVSSRARGAPRFNTLSRISIIWCVSAASIMWDLDWITMKGKPPSPTMRTQHRYTKD